MNQPEINAAIIAEIYLGVAMAKAAGVDAGSPTNIVISRPTVIHVDRRKRPAPDDDTHKALAASLRDGRVEYLPTPRERTA